MGPSLAWCSLPPPPNRRGRVGRGRATSRDPCQTLGAPKRCARSRLGSVARISHLAVQPRRLRVGFCVSRATFRRSMGLFDRFSFFVSATPSRSLTLASLPCALFAGESGEGHSSLDMGSIGGICFPAARPHRLRPGPSVNRATFRRSMGLFDDFSLFISAAPSRSLALASLPREQLVSESLPRTCCGGWERGHSSLDMGSIGGICFPVARPHRLRPGPAQGDRVRAGRLDGSGGRRQSTGCSVISRCSLLPV
jgi:hypothetical protein